VTSMSEGFLKEWHDNHSFKSDVGTLKSDFVSVRVSVNFETANRTGLKYLEIMKPPWLTLKGI
jgi:hypothetical protein